MYSALGIDIEQAIAYCCINGYKVDIIWVCGPIWLLGYLLLIFQLFGCFARMIAVY